LDGDVGGEAAIIGPSMKGFLATLTLVGGVITLAALAGGVAATASRTVANSCAASIVQYQPYSNAGAGTDSLPWVQATPTSAGLVGQLFYYSGTTWQQGSLPLARIYTGGRAPNGGATKILWLAQGSGAELVLVVRGKRLDRRGSFTQRFSMAGGNQFPSIVNVPTAGCWQLQLSSGTKSARVTFLAVKPVSASQPVLVLSKVSGSAGERVEVSGRNCPKPPGQADTLAWHDHYGLVHDRNHTPPLDVWRRISVKRTSLTTVHALFLVRRADHLGRGLLDLFCNAPGNATAAFTVTR
jgi:hypothetical protein